MPVIVRPYDWRALLRAFDALQLIAIRRRVTFDLDILQATDNIRRRFALEAAAMVFLTATCSAYGACDRVIEPDNGYLGP